MSDKRSSEEIVKDYNNLAFKAGNLQYTIATQTKDLQKINETLQELNLEFVAAKNAEAEAAKEVAPETEKAGPV